MTDAALHIAEQLTRQCNPFAVRSTLRCTALCSPYIPLYHWVVRLIHDDGRATAKLGREVFGWWWWGEQKRVLATPIDDG
jgi:hypothetical protein